VLHLVWFQLVYALLEFRYKNAFPLASTLELIPLLRAACCVLRAACCVLRAACCVLRAACCVLRAPRAAQMQSWRSCTAGQTAAALMLVVPGGACRWLVGLGIVFVLQTSLLLTWIFLKAEWKDFGCSPAPARRCAPPPPRPQAHTVAAARRRRARSRQAPAGNVFRPAAGPS
jgi:hypothetical protein